MFEYLQRVIESRVRQNIAKLLHAIIINIAGMQYITRLYSGNDPFVSR